MHSDTDVADGFVHDTFSSFYPLAAASPVIKKLRLEQHGLRWRHAPAVLGHPLPDGDWALLHRDVRRPPRCWIGPSTGTGRPGVSSARDWRRIGPALIDACSPRSLRSAAACGLLAEAARVGGLEYRAHPARAGATLGAERFRLRRRPLLLAGNAMHGDIPLSAPGSGIFGLLLTMIGQTGDSRCPRVAPVSSPRPSLAASRRRGGTIRCGVGWTRVAGRSAGGHRRADQRR